MIDQLFYRAVQHGTLQDKIANIIRETAADAGISPHDLLSRSRRRKFVYPRHFAIWRARNETTASLPQIGRFFGRDHTSVLHAIRRVEERLHSNEEAQ